MGWEITVAGRTRQFDSKAEAETWWKNWLEANRGTLGGAALTRIAAGMAARVVGGSREQQEAADISLSGKWQVDSDDPIDTYVAQLEKQLAAKGFRLVDWEVGAIDDSNQFTDPATGIAFDTDQIPLRYTVEPVGDGGGPLSFLDPAQMSLGGSPSSASAGAAGAESSSNQITQTTTLVHDRTNNMLADYETFSSDLEQYDAEAIESGRTAEQLAMAAEVIRLAWEKEMWAKAKMIADGISQAAADQVWNAASKTMDPTTAAEWATNPEWGLGTAIGNLIDSGKPNIAQSILEAETMTVSAGNTSGPVVASAPKSNLPPGGPQVNVPSLEDIFNSLTSGGGGFSAPEPVYTPPDRREVRDQVRGILVALVGTADNQRLERLTDKYMSAHKRAWENPEIGLEPRMDVYEDIRKSADYKNIHKLRPDTVEEADWVGTRTYLGERYGLSANRAQSFGINQAVAGTAQGDLEDAAAMYQVADSGRLQGTLLGKIRQNITTMAQGMV